MVPGVPDASPAITGTGNKRRRINEPIRRLESAFMYSPEEQRTAGIPVYMPFTSHRFKRIDVYFYGDQTWQKSGNGLPVFILPRQCLRLRRGKWEFPDQILSLFMLFFPLFWDREFS